MADPELRQDEELLGYVRRTMFENVGRNETDGKPMPNLGRKPSLRELGLTGMAARLGMPPAGYSRGEAWERLHRAHVWKRGVLPAQAKVLEAIHQDLRMGTMRKVAGVSSVPVALSPTIAVNTKLSEFLRAGSLSMAGRRRRHGRPPSDGHTLASSSDRPSGSGSQVARLFAIIHQHKQRGFRPNRVTANIALKCWLRSLEAPSRLRLITPVNGIVHKPRVGRSLHSLLDHATLDQLLSNTGDTRVPSPAGDEPSQPDSASYERHVRPLGRLLVRAARSRGDWLAARRILTRLSLLRTRPNSALRSGK